MNAALQLDPLHSLPCKVRRPLEQLLAIGHIDRAIVDDVLAARELAGETARLLGFAVSYLSLQRQGVPVRDVIAMARAQRCRINLSWSGARWRAEHDRLTSGGAVEIGRRVCSL